MEKQSRASKTKMKKISEISVNSKGFLANKYFRILTIILLILMLIMSAVLISIYIDVNKENTVKNNPAKNIISQADKSADEYAVFEDEKGKFGVSDKNEKVIIEPIWNEIYILSKNRFIVGKSVGTVVKMGIIDGESNIIVPFIFDTFYSLSSDYIGGFTENKNNFFLFDKSGELLINKRWTEYKLSDDIIYLFDFDNEYRCKYNDGQFQIVYISLACAAEGIPFNIMVTNYNKINKTGIENLERISEITRSYLSYLISGSSDISDLTSEQYYSALSSNDFFRECVIKSISDCEFDIVKEKSSESYNVRVVINYDYRKKNSDLINISSEIVLNIVSDENNRLVLKSINKTEL